MRKLLAISLSLILLISNIGLTLASHFCGGEMVKSQLMVGQDHLGCGMTGTDMASEPLPEEGKIPLSTSDCCENHYQTLEIEDDYKNNQVKLSFNLQFVLALVQNYLNITFLSDFEKPQFVNYSPPLLPRDIPVLNQVFII